MMDREAEMLQKKDQRDGHATISDLVHRMKEAEARVVELEGERDRAIAWAVRLESELEAYMLTATAMLEAKWQAVSIGGQ